MNVYSAIKMPMPWYWGSGISAFVRINCGSVIVVFSSNKPEGVGGQVGDVCFFQQTIFAEVICI
jgi:hypothetical protein